MTHGVQEAWAQTAAVLRHGELRAQEMQNQEESVRYMAEEMRRAGAQLYERAESDQQRRTEVFEEARRRAVVESEQYKEAVEQQLRARVALVQSEAAESVRRELSTKEEMWAREKERAERKYNAEVKERNDLREAFERQMAVQNESRAERQTSESRRTDDLRTEVDVERAATRYQEAEALKMRRENDQVKSRAAALAAELDEERRKASESQRHEAHLRREIRVQEETRTSEETVVEILRLKVRSAEAAAEMSQRLSEEREAVFRAEMARAFATRTAATPEGAGSGAGSSDTTREVDPPLLGERKEFVGVDGELSQAKVRWNCPSPYSGWSEARNEGENGRCDFW